MILRLRIFVFKSGGKKIGSKMPHVPLAPYNTMTLKIMKILISYPRLTSLLSGMRLMFAKLKKQRLLFQASRVVTII